MLVASLWLAVVVAIPGAVAWLVTAVALLAARRRRCSPTAARGSTVARRRASGPAAPTSRRRHLGAVDGARRRADPPRSPDRRGRRPRLPGAAALPQARGQGRDHRPGRPRAVLAGQHRGTRRSWPARCAALVGHLADERSHRWVLFGHGRGQLEDLDRVLAGERARRARRWRSKAIDKSWKVATGKKPPENPADPDVDIGRRSPGPRHRRPRRARPDVGPAPGRGLLRQVHRHLPPGPRSATASEADRIDRRPRPGARSPASWSCAT